LVLFDIFHIVVLFWLTRRRLMQMRVGAACFACSWLACLLLLLLLLATCLLPAAASACCLLLLLLQPSLTPIT